MCAVLEVLYIVCTFEVSILQLDLGFNQELFTLITFLKSALGFALQLSLAITCVDILVRQLTLFYLFVFCIVVSVTVSFHGIESLLLRPTPNLEDQGTGC